MKIIIIIISELATIASVFASFIYLLIFFTHASHNASLLLLCLRYLPSLLLIAPPPFCKSSNQWFMVKTQRLLPCGVDSTRGVAEALMEGIPEVAMPVNQATSERAETGAAAAAPVSGAPYSSSLNLFPQETISHSGVGGVGSLDFLRNNQQFQALRSMVHTNPQILQELICISSGKLEAGKHCLAALNPSI